MSVVTTDDGVISPGEFVVANNATGMSADGSIYVFYRIDHDENLNVTKEEYMANFDFTDMDGMYDD